MASFMVSDLCTVRYAGTSLLTAMTAAWLQGKSKTHPILDNTPSETCAAHELTQSAGLLPYDIAEMIIAHLTHDLATLKAYSLTCRSWYIAVVPHLHHTLTFKRNGANVARDKLRPLSDLHELDLIPLIKEIRIKQLHGTPPWLVPHAFSHRDLQYFSAFTNVHTLKLQNLEIHRFFPGIERYFEHFSPTLRSIVLSEPRCTPLQLSHFLSFFKNLDDIEIWRISTIVPSTAVPDTELVPPPMPKLRGKLTLYEFYMVETWTHLLASCGGLRFHYMNLRNVTGCGPVLLEACAETLETLRFGAGGDPCSEWFLVCLSTDLTWQ